MSDRITRVALDAMGGDNAPLEIIKGAVQAVQQNSSVEITLVGRQADISGILSDLSFSSDRLNICPASEVIEMAEPPVNAIRTKKDSSMVKGMLLVKDGTCDAFITAGSTGACLVGGQVLVGRLKGIERPPLAPLLPTAKGPVLLIDCGANVDARSSHLVQFAQMGSIYMENIAGIKDPRVGLFNIGQEPEKGNALVKETYPLLEELDTINFIGNVEARDIPAGVCDVVVCDAFVGNAILKMYEGVASVLLKEIKTAMVSNPVSTIGAMLVKGTLKKNLQRFDSSQYGGAPLLGLKGLVVKTHGNADADTVCNSILQCISFHEADINAKFKDIMQLVDRTAGKDS
ncbi:MAG: phosphate acyltransferase PlsX [Lachnospiraceae bacterium]|nr:phosphate acyltransferase PlsX [Lachnospiraceae bacterium]